MRITLAINTDKIIVEAREGGFVDINFDEKDTQKDLFKALVEVWVENNKEEITDYVSLKITHKDKIKID